MFLIAGAVAGTGVQYINEAAEIQITSSSGDQLAHSMLLLCAELPQELRQSKNLWICHKMRESALLLEFCNGHYGILHFVGARVGGR